MAITGKKIGAIPAWNGDKTMRIHASKPGVSEAVSIADIVSAAAASAGSTGDVVLRLAAGTYADAVALDGSVTLDPATHQDLVAILGTATGYGPGVAKTYTFESIQDPFEVEMVGDSVVFNLVDRYVYEGVVRFEMMKGGAFSTSLRFLRANELYGFRAEGAGVRLFRFNVNAGIADLDYLHPDINSLAQDVGFGGFQIVANGADDVIFYPAAGVFKKISGLVVSDISVGLSVTDGRFNSFSGSASANGRSFFSAYDTQLGANSLLELTLNAGVYELILRDSGAIAGSMRGNSTHLFILSNQAWGGDAAPELVRYDLSDFSAKYVPDFLSESGKGLSVTGSAVYFMSAGRIYDCLSSDLGFKSALSSELGQADATAIYASDSALVLASAAGYTVSAPVQKVALPVVKSPSNSLNYFIKT